MATGFRTRGGILRKRFGEQQRGNFRGHGDGTFQAPVNDGVGVLPQTVITGDFNGDGFIDLVVGDEYSASLSLLFGNGDGTFQPARAIPGYQAITLAAGGFQRGRHTGSGLRPTPGPGSSVLLGNGDGTFQELRRLQRRYYPESITVGDLMATGNPT